MSIRTILSNAIESSSSTTVGELLDMHGFGEVDASVVGEALLHYAESAPLAHAEALAPVVAAYHRQSHGISSPEGDLEMLSSELPDVSFEEATADLEPPGGDSTDIDSTDIDPVDPVDAGFDASVELDGLDGPMAGSSDSTESAVDAFDLDDIGADASSGAVEEFDIDDHANPTRSESFASEEVVPSFGAQALSAEALSTEALSTPDTDFEATSAVSETIGQIEPAEPEANDWSSISESTRGLEQASLGEESSIREPADPNFDHGSLAAEETASNDVLDFE